ncbi:MAG: STAS domain-containing protein [Spirochaetaceae bacterium]
MEQDLQVVSLEGAATIAEADALRTRLSETLATTSKVLVNLSHVSRMDLAGIQVLYAARRTATANGVAFHLTGTVSDAVREALEAGGFVKQAPTDARELEAALLDFVPEE